MSGTEIIGRSRRRGRRLFKRDHPRAIDCYIDYFGGRSRTGGASAPRRGPVGLLERLLQKGAAPVAAHARSVS
jgi:hypothetical protein